jgi:Ulp1 family protease
MSTQLPETVNLPGSIIVPAVDPKYHTLANDILTRSLLPDCNKYDVVADASTSLTGKTYPVKMRDIKRLTPEVFLNDTIINLAMGELQREAIGEYGTNAPVFEKTLFYDELLKSSNNQTRHTKRQHTTHSCTKLYTIVNIIEQQHWIAVEVDYEQNKVCAMDSMLPKTNEPEHVVLRKVLTDIKNWARISTGSVQDAKGGLVNIVASYDYDPNKPWRITCCKQCPQQPEGNDTDCGLFALAAVACKSRRVAYHSAQDILGQRPMLASWIVSLGLPKPSN